jgi:hypothetical protein
LLKEKASSVEGLFLTQFVNVACVYALNLVVGGVETVVVIDDFLPFKKNKVDEHVLSFGKTTEGENEIWMMLLEKAIAKICGSYEAMEN